MGSLQLIDPKIVITFIDNSESFHWLAKNLKSAKFIAIQNGNRMNDQLENSNHYHEHFFCYGKYERDLYNRFGFTVNHYYPVGSIVVDYYRCRLKKQKSFAPKYDLCIASSFRVINKERVKSMKVMNNYLARYIRKNDIKVSIALGANKDYLNNLHSIEYHNERDYYKNLFGNNIDLIEYFIRKNDLHIM